ncbi:hypothetical protein GCM10010358_01460 [Streptomyces minutiscleroticus]|uniref:Uncharacterized protein n=1 Tax=Streptomyces minutiscleroticus TaxID=68238 RepID=A0A918K8L8_9ACTN|nr:hypothetical protein GCM10010358_01460 [Streptomyces minutiscleroticus]
MRPACSTGAGSSGKSPENAASAQTVGGGSFDRSAPCASVRDGPVGRLRAARRNARENLRSQDLVDPPGGVQLRFSDGLFEQSERIAGHGDPRSGSVRVKAASFLRRSGSVPENSRAAFREPLATGNPIAVHHCCRTYGFSGFACAPSPLCRKE